MPTFETAAEAYARGFERGNYGAAYESEDWDSWYANNCTPACTEFADAYADGMLLGFHSSLEVHEIGDPQVAEMVDSLRAKYGEG